LKPKKKRTVGKNYGLTLRANQREAEKENGTNSVE
jgi:hypothetical protein